MNWKLLRARIWWAYLRARHWVIEPLLRDGFRKNPYYEVEGVRRGKGVAGLTRYHIVTPDSREAFWLEQAKPTIVPHPLLTAEQFFARLEKYYGKET